MQCVSAATQRCYLWTWQHCRNARYTQFEFKRCVFLVFLFKFRNFFFYWNIFLNFQNLLKLIFLFMVFKTWKRICILHCQVVDFWKKHWTFFSEQTFKYRFELLELCIHTCLYKRNKFISRKCPILLSHISFLFYIKLA